MDKAVSGAIEGLGLSTTQPTPENTTSEKYKITRRSATGVSPDQDKDNCEVKADDKGAESPTKPSPSKPTSIKSSYTSSSPRTSSYKDSKDENTTTPGKIPLSTSSMALSALLSGASGLISYLYNPSYICPLKQLLILS